MALPKDVDEVTLQVLSQGVVKFNGNYKRDPVTDQVRGPNDVLLMPATLGVVKSDGTATPVKVRVVARQRGVARLLREAVTTIPQRRSAMLRIPIQWLCDGSAREDAANAAKEQLDRDLGVSSSCPEGQTCRAGTCVPQGVDDNELADFEPSQVFGGAETPASGACFDTVACFANGVGAEVEFTTCSIEKPTGGQGVSVALVKPAGTDGICGPDACLVPIDAESDTGFRTVGTRIVLPRAACDRILDGSVLSVAVTTACAPKSAAVPTCGPWSSVQSQPGTTDAGAPVVGADAGGPPAAPPPPSPGAPAGDGAEDLVLAVTKLDFTLGDPANGWKRIGYNLDRKVTVPDPYDTTHDPPLPYGNEVCQPVDGKYPGYAFEGSNGVDNSFGFGVVKALDSLQPHKDAAGGSPAQLSWYEELSTAITSGRQTLLLDLGKVGAKGSYLGLVGGLYTGAPRCAATGADGGACVPEPPRLDGSDTWPIAGGINTNENAGKRLLFHIGQQTAARPILVYRLLVWKCVSHQSNLVVLVAIAGRLVNNALEPCDLCGTLSRLTSI
jgi:hypothetical protein